MISQNTLKFLVVLSLFISVDVFANPSSDDESIGRLSDGRAFRTDKEGFQLVDHVAELEVTIDDLRKQVRALENELNDRGDSNSSQRIVKEINLQKPPTPAPVVTRTNGLPPASLNCTNVIQPIKEQNFELQRALNRQTNVARQSEEESRAVIASLKTQINDLQNALMSENSMENLAKEKERLAMNEAAKRKELEMKLNPLEQSLQEASQTVAEKERAERTLKNKVGNLSKEVELLQLALQKSQNQYQSLLGEYEQARASLKSPAPTTFARQVAAPAPKPKPVSYGHSDAQVKQAKGEFSKKLSSIQSLIKSRKRLHDKLSKKRKGLSLRLQPLVTKSGVSLDTLRVRIKKLNSKSNIAKIRKDLKEITGVLSSDLNLLRRVA